MVMASPPVMENDNMQASSTTPHEAKRDLGAQMARLGVRLLNKYGQVLQCEHCGATWTPLEVPAGASAATYTSGGELVVAVLSGERAQLYTSVNGEWDLLP